MGEGMDHTLVLLHGFPEHWWAWRDVLPTLAESTSRVFALDLRGFGTSDLTRGDCDLQQMANDVIGVVRALGVASFSVAGMGIGGTVAWMIGALAPLELQSVAVLSAPHPLGVQPVIGRAPWAGGRVLQGRLALPTGRERALRSGSLVTTVFRAWASPGNVDDLVSQSGTYRAAASPLRRAHRAARPERRTQDLARGATHPLRTVARARPVPGGARRRGMVGAGSRGRRPVRGCATDADRHSRSRTLPPRRSTGGRGRRPIRARQRTHQITSISLDRSHTTRNEAHFT